eukprot:CAMPEP_0117427730 /NCGR_PEP_ID=MMETSP0758-20121206/7539_1 /TAXON_ID=63605 /ORGANISM="Percolomonas cosmopolitus, Strain AE-1 (ATCC 50343)" /LENGTH=128 /DNA_ID=CAMNT_0005213581 /DNA_START=479 /DNA_END=862 /DNA_ORIENTATION=+
MQLDAYIKKIENAGFKNGSYDVLSRNCNHFSEELAKALFQRDWGIPKWINRAAGIGSRFSGLFGRKNKDKVNVEKDWSAFKGEGRSLSSSTTPSSSNNKKKRNSSSSTSSTTTTEQNGGAPTREQILA